MRIVVAGGSGFLGSVLTAAMREAGHEVLVLTRHLPGPGQAGWNPDGATTEWRSCLDGADAVVNLAGEPLDSGRWTPARKARLLASRITATRALVNAIAASSRPPSVLINASAVGYYGAHGDEVLTEASPPGHDFLASICRAWEDEAMKATPHSRVALLRTGLPLSRNGGALPPLALPFRLFAGGRAGTGDQWWSWIHIDDWVGLVQWILSSPAASGPVNLTAPAPVRNREFARSLAAALGRPALIPAPAFALRLLLGEMADAVILNGQRVIPQQALSAGYQFKFPTLDVALGDLYGRAG